MSTPWIKKLEMVVKESLEIPMWGEVPSFPLDALIQDLKGRLQLEDLSVTMEASEWRTPEKILTGLGQNPILISLNLSPLGAPAFWAMPYEDIMQLVSWLASEEGKNFSDPELIKGFYRYLLLEGALSLQNCGGFGGLSLKLSENMMPQEESFTLDVHISHAGQTVWGRLISPLSLQQEFKEHFAHYGAPFESKLSPYLDVPLSLTLGSVALTPAQIKKIKVHDCIILDSCSYFPETKKGTLTLALNCNPLFQIKLKDEKIKILDFAHYYEDLKMEENNYEESSELDMEGELEGDEGGVSVEKPETLIAPDKLLLTLTVEAAKIKMSLEKLSQLQPGNTLELPVRPEQGVFLTHDGQVIARGELVQIGEMLGVKITETHTS